MALLLFVLACGDTPADPPINDGCICRGDASTLPDAGTRLDAGAPFDAARDDASRVAEFPADLLDLTNWKLTLPVETDHEGNPDEIVQPELATFVLDPYFRLTDARDAVVFRAHAGGATTGGSSYPRSELREMNGAENAAWSLDEGTHVMTIRQAITHLPEVKPHVVAGQIHDAEDDVVMIRLEDTNLFVEGGAEDLGTLDPAYVLGTVFTIRVEASGGEIRIWYDDGAPIVVTRSGDGMYFKAGCYTQSNTERGDDPAAYGEVVIYDLTVEHR